MTTTELKKIKKNLPTGYIRKLIPLTKKSGPYISQVLNGKRNSLLIIDAAIALAEAEKLEKEARSAKLQNL